MVATVVAFPSMPELACHPRCARSRLEFSSHKRSWTADGTAFVTSQRVGEGAGECRGDVLTAVIHPSVPRFCS